MKPHREHEDAMNDKCRRKKAEYTLLCNTTGYVYHSLLISWLVNGLVYTVC